jgi:acyl carrier protein
MTLPREIYEFLSDNALRAGVPAPQGTDDLFQLGVLDSFSLVDFIVVLERACDRRVPDSDVSVPNFRTLEMIETYLERLRGQSL